MLIASVIGDVFLLEDARGKRVLVVGVEHGHGFLHDDGAMIEFLVHQVHRAARHFHSVGEGLLLRFEAGKCG